MVAAKDVSWIVFFLVYGIGGSITIFHRILPHEILGLAHREHAWRVMVDEVKRGCVRGEMVF